MVVIIGLIISSSLIIPSFADDEVTIDYHQKEPKFSKSPIVCIFEPDEPLVRQVIKDEWMRQAENGIKSWQYALMNGEEKNRDKWRIDIIKIPLDKQEKFENSFCTVEVRFTGTPNPRHPGWVGWERFDGEKSQIRIFYMTKEICGYKYDEEEEKNVPEFCYKDNFRRSGEIGNIAVHEFGHSMGLGHYVSSDNRQNQRWSIDSAGSPSVMTLAVHYNEELNPIRQIDVDKVKEIYLNRGFGKFTPIPQDTQIKEPIEESDSLSFDREEFEVPLWIKVNSKYWSDGKISQSMFTDGIQYLVDRRVIIVSNETISGTDIPVNKKIIDSSIPIWIKITAGWWADGQISNLDFFNAIENLVERKIIALF